LIADPKNRKLGDVPPLFSTLKVIYFQVVELGSIKTTAVQPIKKVYTATA
jgi:hypothetical protein